MEDVQNYSDERGIALEKVGVSDLTYPITVLDRKRERQDTVANISLSVDLPHHFKGTHMSRFVEILEAFRGEITLRTIPRLLNTIRERLDAECAHVNVTFPYFLERSAPISLAKALMRYYCRFVAEVKGSVDDFVVGIQVPVTSLCPCSKAVSDYGAHNQRGIIDIEIRTRKGVDQLPEMVWFEELIDVAEASASAPVFPLLKREDERHVTMLAYDNPVFVEDIVRNVAKKLMLDERIVWFRVRVDNHESIHAHNAFAQLSWQRKVAVAVASTEVSVSVQASV